MSARTVLTASDVDRTVRRMAHEILEAQHGVAGLVLLGIPTRGVALARRIADAVARIEPDADPALLAGALDVTLHRDDLARRPLRSPQPTRVPVDVDGATVVLVDDVLSSGRTVRAALDALSALGRPRAVRLAVLVDRGHRELPIRADVVGRNLPTSSDERVRVLLAEVDGRDGVVIEGGRRAEAADDDPGEGTGRGGGA